MNDAGVGIRTIMDKLHQRDQKSAARYAAGDFEVVRATSRKIGRLT